MSIQEDHLLIKKLREGDSSAFEALFHHFASKTINLLTMQ